MTYEDLLLEKKGGVATITLNAPEKLNAVTTEMRRSLLLASEEVARDDDVRAVIVTGAGRGFCSGADLSPDSTEMSRYERLEIVGPNFGSEAFFKIDKPVIAAINGPCAGAGFSLALSCDIRIASEVAMFTTVFVLRGRVPDCGMTYWLPRIVGISTALELMFTGEKITAAEAKEAGIVSRVVPPDRLMETAQELAAKIAQQPPLSIELTKRMVYRSMIDDIARHIDLETWAQGVCYQSEDQKEAVSAFMEKRPPRPFKGK